MIKLDLITGFLGAGKTTFLKKYARYLLDKGNKICIIENDFGAINVDLVLMKELEGDNCNLEMVIGGDGAEAHKRRLKTKLIAMAMMGYDRVIIEPSGVYDVDEFFDLLYEEPLDRWYEIGNVITIINPKLNNDLSDESRYLFMSEAAEAGAIVLSRSNEATDEEKTKIIRRLNDAMSEFGCSRVIDKDMVFDVDFENIENAKMEQIIKCGVKKNSYVKIPLENMKEFQTVFYFDYKKDINELLECSKRLFLDPKCGKIHRIKGIVDNQKGKMYEINITCNDILTNEVMAEKAVLIIIGEELNKEAISDYFGVPSL